MSLDDFVRLLRGLAHRRPFKPFLIEFHSGDRILIAHPEAIDRLDRADELFIYRGPDRDQRIFAPDSVCQLIDPPPTVIPF